MLGLVSSVLRQEIGWEERLRNDLFCVELDHNTLIQTHLGDRGLTWWVLNSPG